MSKNIYGIFIPKEPRPSRPDYNYIEFIEAFIEEYEKLIDSKELIKLRVLEMTLERRKPKEIKDELKKLCKNHSVHYAKELISPYLRSDNKKINRLWTECPTIQGLPRLIGFDNLVRIIIRKYPFPELAGLPYKCWSDELMLNYILLRFKISKENCDDGIKSPSIGTIKNALLKNGKGNKYETLDEILKYYLEHSFEYNFYYLHMRKKKYDVSEVDKTKKKSSQHNSTYFSLLFEFKKEKTQHYSNYMLHTSYNSKIQYICLDYIFSKFYELTQPHGKLNEHPEREPVFIICSKYRLSMFKKYYNDLEEAPKYHFLIFDTFGDIYTALDMIKLNPKRLRINAEELKEDFKDIKDIITSDTFKKKLKSKAKKREYIAEMGSVK